MNLQTVNFLTAFVFGFLAFFSPCTFPLIPSFLIYLGTMRRDEKNLNSASSSFQKYFFYFQILSYIFGMCATLVLLGITVGSFGYFFRAHRFLLQQIGGIFVIFFAMQILGFLRISFFMKEVEHTKIKKFIQENRKKRWDFNLIGAFLLGIVFTLGWIPCLSLVLGGILSLAAGTNPLYGGILLFIYAFGQALPLLVFAVFYDKLISLLPILKRKTIIIQKVSGWLLLILGLYIVTNQYVQLSNWFSSILQKI